MESTDKKIVFISYCHEDVSEEWIVKLIDALKNYNIECIVDFNVLKYGQDINSFMDTDLQRADKVYSCCSCEGRKR